MHADATPFNSTDGTNSAPSEQMAYKIPHAAKVLDLSPRYVWQLVHSGEIESFTIGVARRISREALVAYIEKRKQAAA